MKINATLLTALLLGSLPAIAGTAITTLQPAPAPASPWTVNLSVYGWIESLDGDMGVRGHVADVDIGFDEILNNLDFVFMGALEVGYNRWSLLADVNYAEISDSAARGGSFLRIDEKQFLGNFTVAYEAIRTDTTRCDIYAGIRVNWIDAELETARFNDSGSEAWVDPIIGARIQQELPNNFFVRAVGDIGGFGAASDFTWQAMAGFGYSFHERGSLLLGYRAIGTDYSNGGFTYDMVTHGPIIGYEFHF